ncbi:MAG: hypothetical protein RIR43_2102 [Pseudomonadota bacterium]|jgi:hypothetical protein
MKSSPITHEDLARALREALRTSLDAARRFDPPPTLDLAVVAFPTGSAPVWANVLVTRGHHEGVVARIGPDASAVQDIRYLVDPTDDQRRSIAWQPGADWTQLKHLPTLYGQGPFASIAPYPASLIKLMVAVGVGLLVDQEQADWNEPWTWGGTQRRVVDWADRMITESRNDDTSALVALLHARGLIQRNAAGQEVRNGLHEAFAAAGLPTLRLANTRADGGWLNRDGAGVGHLQMTAWDTVRLLWLMLPAVLPEAPPPPWLPASHRPLMGPAAAAPIWRLLGEQALHEVLSSSIAVGLPGWRPGIPAEVPQRWIQADGRVRAADRVWPGDVRPVQQEATVRFAHKTGTTENYLSDAGLVSSRAPGGRRYLVALLSTLGSRHAPHPNLATDWCIADLGARIDRWMADRLG